MIEHWRWLHHHSLKKWVWRGAGPPWIKKCLLQMISFLKRMVLPYIFYCYLLISVGCYHGYIAFSEPHYVHHTRNFWYLTLRYILSLFFLFCRQGMGLLTTKILIHTTDVSWFSQLLSYIFLLRFPFDPLMKISSYPFFPLWSIHILSDRVYSRTYLFIWEIRLILSSLNYPLYTIFYCWLL